jgi:hypothetical protein
MIWSRTPRPGSRGSWRRRAAAAGVATKLGNHSFRTTGDHRLSQERRHVGKAAVMANPASTRATRLYDRRRDEVSFDEVERVVV